MPRKYEALLWDLVLSGRPYTVELLRCATGRWRAHVSFMPAAPEAAVDIGRGVVGLGLNPHGVAMANVGRDGNPESWPSGLAGGLHTEAEVGLHKYAGELQVGVAPGRVWLHARRCGGRARIGGPTWWAWSPIWRWTRPWRRAGRWRVRSWASPRSTTPTVPSTGTAVTSRTPNWRSRSTGGHGGSGYPRSWWTPRTHRWRVGGAARRSSGGRCMRPRPSASGGRRWGTGGGSHRRCRNGSGGCVRRWTQRPSGGRWR